MGEKRLVLLGACKVGRAEGETKRCACGVLQQEPADESQLRVLAEAEARDAIAFLHPQTRSVEHPA